MIIAKVNHNRLIISRGNPKLPCQILWINQGLYALIPVEVVRDEMRIASDHAKLHNAKEEYVAMHFTWNQAIEIPPEAGRILAGEQK